MHYYYANPTGNITLLAPLPEDRSVSLPDAADKLMHLEPSAEQVGFLSPGSADCDITLQMAGGEFCGNAALSAAAVACLETTDEYLLEKKVRVSVSGNAQPISVTILRCGKSSFCGDVEMPSPLSVEEKQLTLAGKTFCMPVVRFPGITHILSKSSLSKATAEAAVRNWCCALDADALGIMLLDQSGMTLRPLVYVRKSNTLFWEGSCASGTTAAGAYLRMLYGPGSWEFDEPAGKLKIRAEENGRLILSGSVTLDKRPL